MQGFIQASHGAGDTWSDAIPSRRSSTTTHPLPGAGYARGGTPGISARCQGWQIQGGKPRIVDPKRQANGGRPATQDATRWRHTQGIIVQRLLTTVLKPLKGVCLAILKHQSQQNNTVRIRRQIYVTITRQVGA